MHSAGVARIALLIGRVRRLSRLSHHGGAPGECQDDEERGKPTLPVHQFSQAPGPADPPAIDSKPRRLAPLVAILPSNGPKPLDERGVSRQIDQRRWAASEEIERTQSR